MKVFVDENGRWHPLSEEIVRCKDCKHRGDSKKCVLSAISEEKDFPLFMLDNHGDWFCADGKRKEVIAINSSKILKQLEKMNKDRQEGR